MLIAAMVVAGAASYLQLGVDRFPRMDLPSVYVRTSYRGAAPQEIETEITQPLEEAVATVEGIDELRSVSSDGVSLLLLTFKIDRDIDAATQDVRDAINSVLNRLPPGTDPPVIRKQDVDASPVLSLAIAGQRDRRELYVLADRDVKNIIESARGVGQVTIAALPIEQCRSRSRRGDWRRTACRSSRSAMRSSVRTPKFPADGSMRGVAS